MHELRLASQVHSGRRVVVVAGEVDITTAPALRARLSEAARLPGSGLIVDLADVTFMDARGLGVLIGVLRGTRHLDHGLRLAAPSPQVVRLLGITGLDRHLPAFPSVDAAVASPPAEPPAEPAAGPPAGPAAEPPAEPASGPPAGSAVEPAAGADAWS